MYCLLFDIDGTLVDSESLIVKAMQFAFENAGHSAPTPEAIRSVIGLSLPIAIGALGITKDHPLLNQIAENYKTGYAFLRDQQGHPEPLFSGAIELIKELSKNDEVLLGIATGKSMRGVQQLFRRYELAPYFHTIQTADNAPSKPHPAMIEQALQETGVNHDKAIMIGDTSFDMEMANNAGIEAIAVTWGHHSHEELKRHRPKHIVKEMQELQTTLNCMIAL